MTLTISLLREEVDHGTPRSETRCPIALRLGAMGHSNPRVAPDEGFIYASGERYRMPASMRRWTRAFDNGRPVTVRQWRLTAE